MHENQETSVHSAKALMEHSQKVAEVIEKKEANTNKTFQLASEQIALLKESNEFAEAAHIEAKKARADSERASKSAFLSNIIAVASLIVAVASLVLTFF